LSASTGSAHAGASPVQDRRSSLLRLQSCTDPRRHTPVPLIGPLNYVADLPGRRPLRSATTNRLEMPPIKLTTVANQSGFLGCRPTDLEQLARRRDVCRVVVHLLPASQNSSFYKTFPDY